MSTASGPVVSTEGAFDLEKMSLRASLSLMAVNARRILGMLNVGAPRALIWVSLAAILEATTATAMPYTTRQLIDSIPVAHVTGIVAVPLFWLAIEAALLATQSLAESLSRLGTRIIEVIGGPSLLERVLEKSCRVPYTCYESPSFLDRLSRARIDSTHYCLIYAREVIAVGQSVLTFVGCLALLLWIAPIWTLPLIVLAAMVPFSFDLTRARGSFALERAGMQRNQKGWYLEWLLSASDPAKEIRALGIGQWLVAFHERIYASFRTGQVAIARRRFRQHWLVAVVATVALYGPYVYFLLSTVKGKSTLGDMLLFVLAFRSASGALNRLLAAFTGAFEYHLYAHNMMQVLDHEEDEGEATPDVDNVVKTAPEFVIEDLWFSYPKSERAVLRGFDLRVHAGETLAIVGRNGIGKTTLVKVLLGLYSQQKGTIAIGGIDTATRSLGWRRDNIGVIFQDFGKFGFEARSNVGIGWAPSSEDLPAVNRAIDMADARGIIEEMPQGIDTPMGGAFGGQEVSGGQWQRIALARLFMRRSRLWILDEPTSAMDADTEERTVRRFRQWTEGRTAIVITHRFATARIADRIAVVDDGRVIEIGTHEELLAAKGDYARIFDMQARAYATAG